MESGLRSLRDTVLLIDVGSCLRSVCLLVERLQSRGESCRETVLLVLLDGGLDCFVGNGVAMREIFGEDAGAGFVFLCDVVVV